MQTPFAPANEPDGTTVSSDDLLRILVALAGRIAFPPEKLLEIVGPYSEAYNLCTGKQTLASISRATGIDKSNLRKAIVRWEQSGVLFRVGQKGIPLGLYSLPLQGQPRKGKYAIVVSPSEIPNAIDEAVDG